MNIEKDVWIGYVCGYILCKWATHEKYIRIFVQEGNEYDRLLYL